MKPCTLLAHPPCLALSCLCCVLRAPPPAAAGKILRQWGANLFHMPHMLTVDRNNTIWITDVGRHQALQFSASGELLREVGVKMTPGHDEKHLCKPTQVRAARWRRAPTAACACRGVASTAGAGAVEVLCVCAWGTSPCSLRRCLQAASTHKSVCSRKRHTLALCRPAIHVFDLLPPLSVCCQVAFLNDGSFLISDGYCNSRVVRYNPDGSYRSQYSLSGSNGQQEMSVPHSLVVDECDNKLMVADRENKKVHTFKLDSGAYVGERGPRRLRLQSSQCAGLQCMIARRMEACMWWRCSTKPAVTPGRADAVVVPSPRRLTTLQ